MLTISRLGRWSVAYYNRTADAAQAASMDRQAAGGGLGEYYSERDTRAPLRMITGDTEHIGVVCGLSPACPAGRVCRHRHCRGLAG